MGYRAMTTPTLTEIERLRELAASVGMGWHRSSGLERIKLNASATAWYELDGRELWVDAAGIYASEIGAWHPDTDLNQVVMVAEKTSVAWRIERWRNQLGVNLAPFSASVLPNLEVYDSSYADGNTPALALLIAWTEAMGGRWRDDTIT